MVNTRHWSLLDLVEAPARQSASLEATEHRPWSLPDGSWIMGQTWEELLFAHWRASVDALRAQLPDGLDLDLYEDEAWIGVTPFRITGLRARGLPALPFFSSFLDRYRPIGDVLDAGPRSLAHFLTERYCLYTTDEGRLKRAEIRHEPWPLQPAEAAIEENTMPPKDIELVDEDAVLHFSARQDVVIWPIEDA